MANALDRIELCTDDVMRIARVTAAGMRVEADIAQRARDLRERADERDAIARARIHVQRLRAAAQEGGPVETRLERGRARPSSPGPAGATTRAVGQGGREWEAISRPYLRGVSRCGARPRPTSRPETGRRLRGGPEALPRSQRLGARVARGRAGGARAARAARPGRGERGERTRGRQANGAGEDPFGLTARERQVLALVAEGATNRQIGAALFMAEKTASVHVSRILSKLGVRSRTQAAAVAHRLHLE